MTQTQLIEKLSALRSLSAESEVVEFKEAKSDFHFDKIGKYFSALSNEANLKGISEAWLVFGIEDKYKNVIGSSYRTSNRASLDSLKPEIARKTTNQITFIEIHELNLPEGRVVMFQLPAAPLGIPVAWEGHYFGRNGEELSPLNIEEIERIRRGAGYVDWSAGIISGATLNDLDPAAIVKARQEFNNKFPSKISEANHWTDAVFLNKAKITIDGKITNASLLLLGSEEAQHLLLPAIGKITWILKDEKNTEKDYEHFSTPLLLSSDKVLEKIRNLNYRYLPDRTLFPIEITQYDTYVIREALHNCIAHQDYSLSERINVVEFPDYLLFQNGGGFIPKSVENVLEQDAPQRFYRNKFLCDAMVNLNMIDTIGSGIRKMFIQQRNRFFPLPDFDLRNKDIVTVIIQGKIIDKNYTQLLMNNAGLSLQKVILLDKVQKKEPINDSEAKLLRLEKLIEGRKPKYFISVGIAGAIGQKATYSKNKAFDKQYYLDLIVKALKEHGSLNRKDADGLLMDKFSDLYDESQKKNKVKNLLTELRKKGIIINSGTDSYPKWILRQH